MDTLPPISKDQANYFVQIITPIAQWVGGALLAGWGFFINKLSKLETKWTKKFEEHGQQLHKLQISLTKIEAYQETIKDDIHLIKNSQANESSFFDKLVEIERLIQSKSHERTNS